MKKENMLVGLDAGHVYTKAVIMRGQNILGFCTVPTGLDVPAAAQTALQAAADHAEVSPSELGGIVATGIFKDMAEVPPLDVIGIVPEYVADAKGAVFLNQDSRTVIDIGGNVHKAISYDEKGNLLDVIQNDKCADGLGIFYSNMARTMGLTEKELSELALQSTTRLSVAVQCALSAESDAIDLMCQGKEVADVADAITRFIVERVADMSTYMSLAGEIVAAGGLAKSQALIQHLAALLKRNLSVLDHPEYVGAIGAVMSQGGGK